MKEIWGWDQEVLIIKEQLVGGLIYELYDEDDTIVFYSADLAHVCNEFHSKLYAN